MNDHASEERDPATADGITELEAHVRCRMGGRVHGFHLVAVANGVILCGHAQTYHSKQLAQQMVMEVAGIKIVANDIEVS